MSSLLTSRQIDVLRLIATGHANKQIAPELSISIKTVARHRDRIETRLKKELGLRFVSEAVLTHYALAQGFIEQKYAYIPCPELTSRESDVFVRIAKGSSNKEMASEFGLSIKTIDKFRQNLRQKLQSALRIPYLSTPDIVHFAIALGRVPVLYKSPEPAAA